jgi:phage gp29-like protein
MNVFTRIANAFRGPSASPEGSVVTVPQLRGSYPQATSRPEDDDFHQLPIAGLQNWTVGSIRAAVMDHQLGQFNQGAVLAETMMSDDRVQSALNGRTKGVARCRPRVVPAPGDAKGKVAAEVKRVMSNVFNATVLDQAMMWQVFSGFALFHVQWVATGTGKRQRWIPRLEAWNLRYCYFDQNSMKYVAITTQGVVYIDFRDPNWLLLAPHGYYRGWLRAGISCLSMAWVVRSLALRDWSRFSEKHGIPVTLVKVPQQGNEADKQRFFQKVRNLGAESTILLPQQAGQDGKDWDACLLEAKDTSWKAFPGLINECNSIITTAIRGTNLTTEVALGSLAAAKTHREEDSDYAESDCDKLCQAADEWLWWWYCAYNFGDPSLCPETHLDPPDSTGMKDFGDGLLALGNGIKACRDAGMLVSIPAMAAKFEVVLEGDPAESDLDVDVDPEDEDLNQDDVSPAGMPGAGDA